tara:strand:- start:1098 stop:1766 length:669 start_codon:yes stop_codon:yes gene_type:complete
MNQCPVTNKPKMPETLMDRLKSETAAAHDRTEAIPFNECIIGRTMPQSRYAGQLECWGRVHHVLETSLDASQDPFIKMVWPGTAKRAPLISADLEWHGEADAPEESRIATTEMVQWVESVASDDPVKLLGILYVLEGSTLGGMILRKHLSELFDIDGEEGLAYYSVHGRDVMPNWKLFKARMNDGVPCPEAQQRIIDAASETFDRLGKVLMGLSQGLVATGA